MQLWGSTIPPPPAGSLVRRSSAARMLHAAYARGVAASFAATLWQAHQALK
ncbi:MAG TPA: hypothetical protein VIK33_18625 [Anaerolineae bacterium]